MLYRLMRQVARVALRWYYRDVEVEGRDRVPDHGPVILAANHNNALVDALVVVASLGREVRLTAKATLLRNPLTRVVVRALGIVPLRRAADETNNGPPLDAARNRQAFDAVVQTLAAQRVVLIFPEGRSHNEPELAPLKTGCARMAVQARAAGIGGILLVPIGLTFEAASRPRSRVVLQVGAPIRVDDFGPAVTADPVAALVSHLDAGLREVTLNFRSHEDASRVIGAAQLVGVALHDVRPLGSPEVPLSDTTVLARRLETIRRRVSGLEPVLQTRVLALEEDLSRWKQESRRLGVPPGDVGMPVSVASGAWFMLREGLLAVTVGPVALWGRLNHWVPLRAALWLGRVTSRNPDEPAMHTLVGGLVLVLTAYALIATVIGRNLGWGWAAGYLLLLPPAASLDFWWSDRVRRAVQRARGYRVLRRFPQQAQWLTGERDRLRSEIHSLARALSQTQDPTRPAGGTDQRGPSARHHDAPTSADP